MPRERKVKIREFASTYSELHALIIGIYSGLTEWHGIESKHMKNPDVQKEPHYAHGGYIIGTILRWIILITLGYLGYAFL